MEELRQILNITRDHNRYVLERVDLSASNSWISQFVRLTMASSLPNNYSVGLPGNRIFGGCAFIDILEREVVRLACQLFHAPYAVLQFLSGMQANVGAYNAILKPGDVIVAATTRNGGHYSHTMNGPLRFYNPRIVAMPFDADRYNVDVAALAGVIERERPRLVILGWSEFLFPYPLAEIRKLCDSTGSLLMYDMSHVVGLIAGQAFQPEAMALADIVTSSTGKSLHAPDHGIVLYRDPAFTAGVMDAVMPLLTSNTHAHELAGVGVALAESLHHGPAYAAQVVRNTKALGRALDDRGVHVLYREMGYSESHTLLIQVTGADLAVQLCDRAGILCSACELPWDEPGQQTGLRFGTQVLTRRGMTEPDMELVADAVARVLVEGDSPEQVQQDIIRPLATRFTGVAFSFDFHFPAADDWYDSPYGAIKLASAEGMVRSLLPFAGCSDAEIAFMTNRLDLIHYKTEQVLFQGGDQSDSVYFVIDGAVDVLGDGQIVTTVEGGGHLGAVGLMEKQARPFAARAHGGSRLLRLQDKDFEEMMRALPSASAYFERCAQSMSGEGRETPVLSSIK